MEKRTTVRLTILLNSFLWIVLIMLSPLILCIVIPLFIARQIEYLYYKKKYNATMIPATDIIWSFDNPKNNPYINGCFRVDGDISDVKVKNRFQQLIDSSNPDDINSAGTKIQHFVHTAILNQYWIKDKKFSLDKHIVQYDGEKITSEQQLLEKIGEFIPEEFNEAHRPPWKFYVIPYTIDGNIPKTALYMKLSHAIADGSSIAYFIINDLADNNKCEDLFPKPKAVNKNYNKFLYAGIFYLPFNILWTLTLRKDMNQLVLDSTTGMKEVLWSKSIGIDKIKEVKNRLQCSINDVLFGCLATTVQKHLDGEELFEKQAFTTICPVDIRSSMEEVKYLSNKFSTIFIQLLHNTKSTLKNIEYTKQAFDTIKNTGVPISIDLAMKCICYILPKSLNKIFVFRNANKATAIASNVIGPNQCVQLMNKNIEYVSFWAPSTYNQSLSISFLSYNNSVCIGVMKDKKLHLDLQKFVGSYVDTLEELTSQSMKNE